MMMEIPGGFGFEICGARTGSGAGRARAAAELENIRWLELASGSKVDESD
jgi:hypothetical protein